jgi:hypothetical protein
MSVLKVLDFLFKWKFNVFSIQTLGEWQMGFCMEMFEDYGIRHFRPWGN